MHAWVVAASTDRQSTGRAYAAGRVPSRWSRVVAIVVLAGVVIAKRRTIFGVLFGSNFVGGNAIVTTLHLPPGFMATVFASGLQAPRFMAFAPNGALYISGDKVGLIYRITYAL